MTKFEGSTSAVTRKLSRYQIVLVFTRSKIMGIGGTVIVRHVHNFLSIFRWNILDVLIVILSIIGIIMEELESNVIPINPTILRIMRVLRIARGSTPVEHS